MIETEGRDTCACGKPATANGRECPEHFRARIRSINLDGSVLETRTRTAGHSEAASNVFGEDAKERMMEDTKGLGYVKTAPDGTPYHRNRKTGEVEALTERQLDEVYTPRDED
jgi:hypothetical protein